MNSESDSFDHDVFISYSHRDSPWLWEWLVPCLKQAGLKVCIDRECFKPGEPSLKAMERAVQSSRKTLLVLTPEYIESEWCEFESILVRTLDPAARQRRAIPVMLKQCDLPLSIGMLTYLDFTQPGDLEHQCHRLVDAVRPDSALLETPTEPYLPPRTWWEAVGFTANPFAYRDASREDVERLSRYFVYPPQWSDVEGNPAFPQTTVVIAEKGMGKTASCRFLEHRCDSGPVAGRAVLAVRCTEQDVMATEISCRPSYQGSLSRITLKILLSWLEREPHRLKRLGRTAQRRLADFVRMFLPGFSDPSHIEDAIDDILERRGVDLEASAVDKGNFGEWEQSAEAPMLQFLHSLMEEPEPEPGEMQLSKRPLDRISRLVTRLGWEAIYVLIDEHDASASREPKAEAERWLCFLEGILGERSALSSVGFKLFLTPETWQNIQLRGNLAYDDLLPVFIELTDADLRRFVGRRLEEYSSKAISSLNQISDSRTGDVDEWLIRESKGCPATLLRLGYELFAVMDMWWHAAGPEQRADELLILPELMSFALWHSWGQRVPYREIEEAVQNAVTRRQSQDIAILPETAELLQTRLQRELPLDQTGLASFGRLWARVMQEWEYGGKVDKLRAKLLAEKYTQLTDELLEAYCTPLDHELNVPTGLSKLGLSMTTSVIDHALEIGSKDQLVFVLVIDAMSWIDWTLCEDKLAKISERLQLFETDVRVAVIPTLTPVAMPCLLSGFLPGDIGVCGWKYVNTDKQQFDLNPVDDSGKMRRKDVRQSSQAVEADFGDLKTKTSRQYIWLARETWTKRQSAFLTGLISQVSPKIEMRPLRKRIPPGIWDELAERIQVEEFPARSVIIIYLDYFDEQSHGREKPSATSIEMYYQEEAEVIGKLLRTIEKRATSRNESYTIVLTADHGKFTQFERDVVAQTIEFAWTDGRKADMEKKLKHNFAPLTGAVEPEVTAKTLVHWVHDADVESVHIFLKDAWEGTPDVIFKVGKEVTQLIGGNPPSRIKLPNVMVLSKYNFTRRIFSDHGGVSLSEMLVPFVRYRVTGA